MADTKENAETQIALSEDAKEEDYTVVDVKEDANEDVQAQETNDNSTNINIQTEEAKYEQENNDNNSEVITFTESDKKKGVELMNAGYQALEGKYSYLVHGGCCGKCFWKIFDIIVTLLVIIFMLLPLLIFWFILILILLILYILLLKWCKYSFTNYIRLFIGNWRLWLLTFRNKTSNPFWHLCNRTLGFIQLLEFFSGESKAQFYELMLNYSELFGGKAYPFLFAIVSNDYDLTNKLIHKTHYCKKGNENDMKLLDDRQTKTFFMFELSKDVSQYGVAHVFSLNDYRHQIMRDIQYILINVENDNEFYDISLYEKTKFKPIPKDYMASFFKYPKCKKYFRALHYGPLFYRIFGVELTDSELIWLNSAITVAAMIAMPNWFHTIFFNNIMLKKAYVIFYRISSIIKERCKNGMLKKLKNYAFENSINEEAVINAATLHFLFAGGNKVSGNIIKRFESAPQREYQMYYKNKTKYILEYCRHHAPIVRTVSNISHKTYSFNIRNKVVNIPPGSIIGTSIIAINDNVSTRYPMTFNVARQRSVYHQTMTWHCRDEYFHKQKGNNKGLNKRFCPGRIIIEPHLIEILDRLFPELKKNFDFSDNELIKVKDIHKSLAMVNKSLIGGLVPGIKKHNAEATNSLLPKDIVEYEEEHHHHNDKDFPLNLPKSNVFGIQLLKNDEYVERSKLKDTVFALIVDLKVIFPFSDNPDYFDQDGNLEDGTKMMQLYLDQKCNMPVKNVIWPTLKSNHSISLFAFASACCKYTKKIDKLEGGMPKNACYMSDTTILSGFKVRKAFHRYGACAYFNNKYELISIYVSHLDRMIYYDIHDDDNTDENSLDKRYGKYVYLTSIIGYLTLVDHAFVTHMIESASLSKCMCQSLPHDHWLSRFLLIFTFRTNYINESINQILMKKNGLVHRIWGFEYSSVETIAQFTIDNYSFDPFYERYDLSMKDTPDEVMPFIIDGKEYYDCIYEFVNNYISSYYDENSDEHQYVQCFYENLCKNLKVDDHNNQCEKAKLCHMVTNLICTVTAFHEQVGGVMDYVNVQLDWLDTKLYKNKSDICQVAKNDFVASAALVMLTGVRNPGIINDFKHILLKDDKLEENKKIFDEWQNKLKELSERIIQRNKNRRIAFNACNPANIECSVSV